MNQTVLLGRLTRDPDVRTTENTKLARYTLAVDRRYKRDGEPSADFIPCVSFGKAAEFAEKYLKQGTKIAVVGRIQTGSYTNKEGNTVYTTDVITESIDFAESKKASDGASAPAANAKAPVTDDDGFMKIPAGIDEEFPF